MCAPIPVKVVTEFRERGAEEKEPSWVCPRGRAGAFQGSEGSSVWQKCGIQEESGKSRNKILTKPHHHEVPCRKTFDHFIFLILDEKNLPNLDTRK